MKLEEIDILGVATPQLRFVPDLFWHDFSSSMRTKLLEAEATKEEMTSFSDVLEGFRKMTKDKNFQKQDSKEVHDKLCAVVEKSILPSRLKIQLQTLGTMIMISSTINNMS